MKIKSLIVVGSGPGGSVAALEGAARGLSVTLIERDEVGGTCLNRGCIPSKFLLSKSRQLVEALALSDAGIVVRLETIDPRQMINRKNELLGTLRQRIDQSLKAAGVRRMKGHARFVTDHRMEVIASGGTTETIEGDAIILATGSSPNTPTLFPKHPAIVNSSTIFELEYIPKHLVVVGGGYIGCELACAFQGLGSKVTIIEKEPRLLPTQPEFEMAGMLLGRSFEKRGMSIWTGTTVESVKSVDDKRIELSFSNRERLEANAVLIAVGRSPNLQDLQVSRAGIDLENGRLRINEYLQTSVPHIYAIGDLVSPVPLAHTASWEADAALSTLLGKPTPINYSLIPRCVYTWPQAAAVGLTETEAKNAGYHPRLDRYHFAGNSKALIENESEGVWISISDAQSHKLLGGQIVGPQATELIHLVALAIKAGLSARDVSDTVFAHPTLSESFREVVNRSLITSKAIANS